MILNNFQMTSLYEALVAFNKTTLPISTGIKILVNLESLKSAYETVKISQQEILINNSIEQDGVRVIAEDTIEAVNKMLANLAQQEKEYDLKIISLSEIKDIEMPLEQLKSLLIIIGNE